MVIRIVPSVLLVNMTAMDPRRGGPFILPPRWQSGKDTP